MAGPHATEAAADHQAPAVPRPIQGTLRVAAQQVEPAGIGDLPHQLGIGTTATAKRDAARTEIRVVSR